MLNYHLYKFCHFLSCLKEPNGVSSRMLLKKAQILKVTKESAQPKTN